MQFASLTRPKQIWQEQVSVSHTDTIHTFVKAAQAIIPPGRVTKDEPELKSGCLSITFDACSALVATQLEECPSVVWIWDTSVAELRGVLVFHGHVSNLSWHPALGETLLIRCDDEQYRGTVFVWDPLSEGPRSISLPKKPSGGKVVGKTRASWFAIDIPGSPFIFLADAHHFLVASLAESITESPSWLDAPPSRWDSAAKPEESPLQLMPTNQSDGLSIDKDMDDEDVSELEDTFIHKH
jgi:hypothetical protein